MRLVICALALVVYATAAQSQPRGIATISEPSAPVQTAIAKWQQGDQSALVRLADDGLPEAGMYLGIFLAFDDEASPEQVRRGCSYIETAAAKSHDAMHILAESYQYGRCGLKDLEKAVATFERAAQMGHVKSKCAAGNVLLELGRDIPRAVALCREGAEAGDPDAQTDLGNIYLRGAQVPKDVDEARRWYERAAAQGQPNAALTLGLIYWNADGVPRDISKSMRLWRVAYDGGRKDAAFHLGNATWVSSQRGERDWDPALLDQAAGWYDNAIPVLGEKDRKEAIERRDLARQLAAIMRRKK